MIQRALIEVTGPRGAGKTALIERILQAFDGEVLVARCVRDDSAPGFRESTPRRHPELRRYRGAGACGTALFTHPAGEIDLEYVFSTDLLGDYSEAIVFEGDHELRLGELSVHVVPVPGARQKVLVRKKRDGAREAREAARALEQLASRPEGVLECFNWMLGAASAEMVRDKPDLLARAQQHLLAAARAARSAPPQEPTEHWCIGCGYEGVERAEVVVLNIRDEKAATGLQRALADIARIRKDPEVFEDVLGWRGRRTPITAVGADLADARHPGTKKALARILRTMRQARD